MLQKLTHPTKRYCQLVAARSPPPTFGMVAGGTLLRNWVLCTGKLFQNMSVGKAEFHNFSTSNPISSPQSPDPFTLSVELA
jgi:hypothetical protein